MMFLKRLLTIGFALMAAPASPDHITFGDTGSIFGGVTWTITADDTVRYSAYQVDGGYSTRKDWVWDNVESKQGHLERVVPGAYRTATAIVRATLAPLGAPPSYLTTCRDAGSFVLDVQVPKLVYTARADNCIPRDDGASVAVRRHYAALRALEQRLMTELHLASW